MLVVNVEAYVNVARRRLLRAYTRLEGQGVSTERRDWNCAWRTDTRRDALAPVACRIRLRANTVLRGRREASRTSAVAEARHDSVAEQTRVAGRRHRRYWADDASCNRARSALRSDGRPYCCALLQNPSVTNTGLLL